MEAIEDLLIEHARELCGSTPLTFLRGDKATLPGFYRPRKNWDIIALDGDRLVFAIEAKSQSVEKLSNNANNRNEEAIGSATDLRLAYDRGLLGEKTPASAPWLGYLFVLEEATASTRAAPQRMSAVFPLDITYGDYPSYERRYQILCQRLLETGLYDGTCFLMSPTELGGDIKQPAPSSGIHFDGFMDSLGAHLTKYCAKRS